MPLRIQRNALALVVAFIIGLVYGGLYLRDAFWKSGNDIDFVVGGDQATNIAGANYFQQQGWHYPLFDFENYRYPEGGSIIYTDSIPLVGLIIKLTHPLHGNLIDYIGWYVLLCYGLNSLAFVVLLRQLGIREWVPVLLGSVLAVAAPVLLHRYGHSALCSHYWIYFSFGMYFQQRKASGSIRWYLYFYLLLIGSLFTHPYLFLMVGVIFAAACMDALCRGSLSVFRFTGLTIAAFAGLFLLFSVTGYLRWDIDMQPTGGFGYYSTNLLSPFWPQRVGWASEQAPILVAIPSQGEGFAWLGFGVWLLFLSALFVHRRRLMATLRKHLWLVLALALLSAIAIGHNIYFGKWHLLTIPLPDYILDPLQSIRGNGRFIWPAIYAILTFSIVSICKELERRKVLVILSIGTLLQLWDTSYYMRHNPVIRERSGYEKRIQETRHSLISRHDRLVLLPSYHHSDGSNHHDLLTLYLIASQYNLPISSSYLARAWDQRNSYDDRQLYLSGGMQAGALYWFMGPRFGLEDAVRLDPSGKYIRVWDNHVILSGQMPALEKELPMLGELFRPVELPGYVIGDTVDLANGEGMDYLLEGIYAPGDWAVGKHAVICMRVSGKFDQLQFNASLWAFLNDRHPQQRVRVRQGGRIIHEETFMLGESMPVQLSFPVDVNAVNDSGMIYLELELPDAISPKQLGTSEDTRELSIQLMSIQVVEQ